MGINYDDINLPHKVSDILRQDFFMLENISAGMVNTVKNPVKFSAFTSIFVTQGSCQAEISLMKYPINAPAVINIPADKIIMPMDVSEDFKASFMVFSKRMIDSLSTTIKDLSFFTMAVGRPIISIIDSDRESFEQFYSNMRRISSDCSNRQLYEAILYTCAAFFFTTANKYFENEVHIGRDSSQKRITDKFMRLVQENFRRERFLEFYADQLEISPKHLSRTVKAHTGLSAVEWINRQIILEAKVMLRSSSLNIQQISTELNFPSQSFFGKYFKKATGLSPKEYRTYHIGQE